MTLQAKTMPQEPIHCLIWAIKLLHLFHSDKYFQKKSAFSSDIGAPQGRDQLPYHSQILKVAHVVSQILQVV